MSFREGQTATNPETGEVLSFKNGSWSNNENTTKPNKTATNPDTGETIQFVDGKWKPIETTTPEEQDSNAFAEWTKENLDLPGGIAGAYAGFKTVAKYSPIKHPLLLGAGGVVGGFIGTFFGSAKSSEYKTGEADYNKALKDASIAAGIDVATLGAYRYLSPVYKALKTKRKGKFAAPEVKIPKEVGASGTLESLQRTQRFLDEGGSTLIPSMTGGRAGKFTELSETLNKVGVFSRRRIDNIMNDNKNIIIKEINKQIDGIDPSLIKNSSDELGDEMLRIIKDGKELNQINYTTGLDRIANTYGNINVPVGNITKTIDDFVAEANKDGINTLSNNTLKVIQKTKENLIGSQLARSAVAFKDLPEASVNKIMTFQKEINKDVSNAAAFNSANPASDAAELAQFSKVISKGIDDTLNIANKGLSKDYRAVNKAYGETLGMLLPKITKGIVTGANNANYHNMGKLLLSNNNVSQINTMMKSIDTAFDAAKKQGLPMNNTSIKTADEAKQMIRQSYIKNFFGDTSGDFDPQKWVGQLASIDKSPNELAKLKSILGKEGFNSFKKLSNAIVESNKETGSDLFGLAVRGRETSAVMQTAGAGIAGSFAGLTGAAAIFVVPEVMGRIAVNKKAVNKLLLLNKQVKDSMSEKAVGKALSASYVAKATASIINELPDYDKEAIKFYMGAKEE